MSPPVLTVVVAVQHAQANVVEILERLDCARHPQVEFLLCFTTSDAGTAGMLPALANARAIECPPGSLIPHLWRDGIRAAQADRVAVTTAHCLPAPDWVAQLLATDLASHAGAGGTFENDEQSDAVGWAIFFLRYLPFAPPQARRDVADIAADNAVYRRGLLMAEADLLAAGFWEPGFHARFRAAGHALQLDPRLRVIHRNRYSPAQFFRQRLAHGREFGLARAAHLARVRRAMLAILSPLLPLVFLRKIAANARRPGAHRGHFARSLPWLCFFLLGWGLGEARGYWESLRQP